MTINSLVSVVIPTYNRGHTIKWAIDSALAQTYKNLEIIIIDDDSTDNTEDIVKKIKDERIYYKKLEINQGGSVARNIGIKLSRGAYIAFLDSDDQWTNDKIDRQIKLLNTMPSNIWGGAYCSFYYIDKNGCKEVKASKSGDLREGILTMNLDIGAASTLMFHKEVFSNVGLFDESFERHQDWEFLIRYFHKYKLYALQMPLVKIYGHNMPVGKKAAEATERYLLKFSDDIKGFKNDIRMNIFARHWIEVSIAYAREGKIRYSMKYLNKSLRYKFLPIRIYIRLFALLSASTINNIIKGE